MVELKKEMEKAESIVNHISVLASTLEKVSTNSFLDDGAKAVVSELIAKEIVRDSSKAWLTLYEARHEEDK